MTYGLDKVYEGLEELSAYISQLEHQIDELKKKDNKNEEFFRNLQAIVMTRNQKS